MLGGGGFGEYISALIKYKLEEINPILGRQWTHGK